MQRQLATFAELRLAHGQHAVAKIDVVVVEARSSTRELAAGIGYRRAWLWVATSKRPGTALARHNAAA
jgi:hypothetical protein